MRRLFATPLRVRNDKVGASEVSGNVAQEFNGRNTHPEHVRKMLGARPRSHDEGMEDNSTPSVKNTITVLTRSSRSRPLAPICVADSPEPAEVSKYSIDKGLGGRWTK
jgi:hypothetical protein